MLLYKFTKIVTFAFRFVQACDMQMFGVILLNCAFFDLHFVSFCVSFCMVVTVQKKGGSLMLEFLVTYRDLFMGFLRPGIFGFGGGPSSIPLIRVEVVDRYGWMTIEEFTDALAFGNMLPGPIATKMAALIGYHVNGIVGSLVAIIANIGPSAVAAILLISFYARFSETTWMSGMMTAVRPVVVVLVAQVVLMMGRTSFTGIQTFIIAAAAVFGLLVFRLHPAVLIALALAYGGVFLK